MGGEVLFSNVKSEINERALSIMRERLDKKQYSQSECQITSNLICEDLLKYLTSVSTEFKYIVNVVILQKSDAGMSMSGSCFWDNELDGNVVAKYDSPTLTGIANIFACAL